MSGNPRLQRVVVFAPTFPPAFLGGGPARTLSALVRDAPETSIVDVLAPSQDADGSDLSVAADAWATVGNAEVYYASSNRLKSLGMAYKELRRREPDVLYLNSFFNLRFSIIPQILGFFGFWGHARIVLAPRGEFDPGALNIRATKKRVFIAGFRLLRLHTRITWHASAEMEALAIRNIWGHRAQVLVRENETSLPVSASAPRLNPGVLRAAFLGRISPKKGLLLALQALEDTSANVQFSIYGPEEDAGYARQCREAAERLPANVVVRFEGPIAPDSVRETLERHDILLMPTKGENFGHVIAEALSVACPVICSSTTPWTDLLRGGGGVVVEAETRKAWRQAIEDAAHASREERLCRRQEAGRVYNEWRKEPKGPHIFSLMMPGAAPADRRCPSSQSA